MSGLPDTRTAIPFACHPGAEAGVTNERVAMVRVGESNAIGRYLDSLV